MQNAASVVAREDPPGRRPMSCQHRSHRRRADRHVVNAGAGTRRRDTDHLGVRREQAMFTLHELAREIALGSVERAARAS